MGKEVRVDDAQVFGVRRLLRLAATHAAQPACPAHAAAV